MKFHFLSSENPDAKKAETDFINSYGQNTLEESDIIIPIGGDGLLLKSLHNYNKLCKPFFGINYGSIGFLMNNESKIDLVKLINNAQNISVKPLSLKARNKNGKIFESIAFNEVSLMRQPHQAAKIKLTVKENSDRPVSVTADHKEFRNILKAEISCSKKLKLNLLFDKKHSIGEKILKEQFTE